MKYNLYKAMVGGRITAFGRACDLISVCIELPDHTMAYLHTQTLTRVIHKSKVILSSYDMCKCGKEEKSEDFKWWETVTDSVYDITLEQITPLLLKSRILKVCPKKTMDLFIYLENDLCLQVLNSTVEECELYRIFDNHEEHDIIVPDLWE